MTTLTLTFEQLQNLTARFFEDLNPMPWLVLGHKGETVSEVATAIFRRWQSPYWEGSLTLNRPWEDGELAALARLYAHLTGEDVEAREKREAFEAEERQAAEERIILEASRVIRNYHGTRLYGALRRAGLEEILRPGHIAHLNAAMVAAGKEPVRSL